MKRTVFAACASLLLSLNLLTVSAAEETCPPSTQWSREFVGTNSMQVFALQQTADGNYVVGGDNFRLSKLDADGAAVWTRTYGGGGETLAALKQTADGGFLLGGNSSSAPSLYKTALSYGAEDFWVVRLDADGNKLWDQSFGGSGSDYLYDLQQTSDGGYLLGGASGSPANGNKSAGNLGATDFWVVRLNSSGQKLWDRSFGGSDSDFLFSVEQTSDGGCILAGQSYTNGYNDLNGLVVRLDADGQLIWQKRFGGTNIDYIGSAQQTIDGGFILGGGFSLPPYNISDAWVIRLDSAGNQLWDKLFGGSNLDGIRTIRQTADGGYLFAANSWSAADGNKTSPNLGGSDFWIVRLDESGNKRWEQTYGSSTFDYVAGLQVTADGGVLFGGSRLVSSGGQIIKLGPDLVDNCDNDGDGVPNDEDLCPNTPSGALVNGHGCSIEELVSCSGPWKNHGEYVNAVKKVLAEFVSAGLLTEAEQRAVFKQAAQSHCGK